MYIVNQNRKVIIYVNSKPLPFIDNSKVINYENIRKNYVMFHNLR